MKARHPRLVMQLFVFLIWVSGAVTSFSISAQTAPSGAPSGYTFCAAEGGTCSFNGTQQLIAFGAGSNFLDMVVKSPSGSGSIACTSVAFGTDPDMGVTKSCYTVNTPSGYTLCAAEGGTCSFNGTQQLIAFGASASFVDMVVKSSSGSGNTACTKAAFGTDPDVGVSKGCYTVNTPSGYTLCAAEGGTCTFNGIRQLIAFGAGSNLVEKVFNTPSGSGSTACTNVAFGQDPEAGVAKGCFISNTAALAGKVMGDGKPTQGATVVVYAAGLNSGDAPMQIATTTTASDGTWSVASFSPSPSNGQLIYVTATGGQITPGVTNPQAEFLTVAGVEGDASFPISVVLNEASTVASVGQLYLYIAETPCAGIANSTVTSGNCPSIKGAANLNSMAGYLSNLVNVATRQVNASNPYPTYPTLNTEASILANCINSAGGTAGDNSVCGNLFQAIWSGEGASGLTQAASVAAPGHAIGVTHSLDGKYVYAANDVSAGISTYLVGSNGNLTLGSNVVDGNVPLGIAVSPDGAYVYVADNSNGIGIYHVGSGGVLTFVSQVADSDKPEGLAVSPDGAYVYVANSSSGIGIYSVGSNGALSFVSQVADANAPVGIAISPLGRYVYVADNLGDIGIYSVGSSGTLSFVSQMADSDGPRGLAVSGSGTTLYVDDGGADLISTYSVGSNGALSYVSQALDISWPAGLTAASNSASLYVADQSNDISMWTNTPRTKPADTVQAALNIDIDSTTMSSSLYNLTPPTPLYSPVLSSAPENWLVIWQ